MPTKRSVFPYLVAVYTTALVLQPVLVTKIVSIAGVVFPGALFLFPLSFICNDIFSEVYGYERSRSIVWAGLFCQLLGSLVIALVLAVPSAPFWQHQEAFNLILGQSMRVTLASLVSYFLGELTNSFILSKMKYKQGGATGFSQINRFVTSTIVGEFVHSALFISLAFVGTYSIQQIGTMVVTTWVLKTLYEVLFLPISIRVSEFVKRVEGVNAIDDPSTTNYGIFGTLKAE